MKKTIKTIFISLLACLILFGSVIGTSAATNKGVIYYVGDRYAINGCSDCNNAQVCAQDCTARLCDLLRQLGCNASTCRRIAIRVCGQCPQENSTSTTPAQPAATEPATTAPDAPTEPEHVAPTQPAVPPTQAPVSPTEQVAIPAVTDNALSAYESEVVRLVNEIRAKYGLSTLTANKDLSRVARLKSQDMHDKGYFSHNSPTYGSPFEMMKTFGIRYRTAGENIAMGYRTPQSVVDGWMNSPGHRANILNDSFTQIGMGYLADGNYWTQMFIG